MSHLRTAQLTNSGCDAVYAQSPRTAAEEAHHLLPGSRFLNTTEFKRIYLGADGDAGAHAGCPSAVVESRAREMHNAGRGSGASPPTSSSSAAAAGPLRTGGAVPRRPAAAGATALRRGSRTAARRLYSSIGDAASAPDSKRHSPRGTGFSSARGALDPSTGLRQRAEGPYASRDAVVATTHESLTQQLRCKVRAARRSPSAHYSGVAPQDAADADNISGRRSEDAWLRLQRELRDEKDKVRSLQRQLRHAQVLVRTLHAVASDDEANNSSRDGSADEAEEGTSGVSSAQQQGLEGGGVKKTSQPTEQRPKEYWQRRAYFLEQQQEALTQEVELLRRDARGEKVRALVKELEVVRSLLKRQRHAPHASSGRARSSARESAGVATTAAGGEEEEAEEAGSGDERGGRPSSGPVALRWSPQRTSAAGAAYPVSLTPATAVDEAFLRQKDDAIRDLRERLRLLTQQYQTADSQVMTATRQLEDLSHRYAAMQTEWRALQRLPQELARVQQQLTSTQARLVDSDREVEAFHQLFDTLESPATLRAVIDERDHLVELLRHSQQQQASLHDEMKAREQQAVRAVEATFRAQRDEAQAMARDREAQQEVALRKLRRQVDALTTQLAAQRVQYEAQLAESAQEREAELTARLLESVAQGEEGSSTGQQSRAQASLDLSGRASRSPPHSVALSSRPPSRDGPRNAAAPRRTPGDDIATPPSQSPLDSMSGLLPAHSSRAASAHRRGSRSPSASVSPEGDELTKVPAAPETGECNAAARNDSLESSLTSTSDAVPSSSSSMADTFTDADEEKEESGSATKPESTKKADSPAAAESAGLPATAPSKTISTTSPPVVAPDMKAPAVSIVQELVSSEDTEEDDEAEAPASHSSHTSSGSSSATLDDGYGLEETIEKARGDVSDSSSSSDSATPPAHGHHEMRIGFGFAKPQDASSSSTGARRGRVFDFPAPPIALVHPVSILVNRASVDGLHFASDLRAVVHSPSTSPQQTATATSDPTQSQPTLTGSDSGSGDEEDEETSSSYSHSLSASSASVSASTPVVSVAAPQQQPEPPQPQAAAEENKAEAMPRLVAMEAEEAKPAEVAAAADSDEQPGEKEAEAPQSEVADVSPSNASSIHSGLRSAPDDSLEPLLPTPAAASPAPARPAQLATAELAEAVTAGATPDQPLARTTVHTPTQATTSAQYASSSNSPSALSVKAAPIPSPPAITPLVTSNHYPPRIGSAQLLPSLHLEESPADGGPLRGGASPRLQSADHSSFDLTHQFSGNASFDFVGPLAERHRMEEMQTNIIVSQHSSPATLPGNTAGAKAAAASAFPSAALGGGNVGRLPSSTGAAGLRKTPSPPLVSVPRPQSSAVLSGNSSGSLIKEEGEHATSPVSMPAEEEGKAVEAGEASVPAAPELTTANSAHLLAATAESAGDVAAWTVDGPAQPEGSARASPLAETSSVDAAAASTPLPSSSEVKAAAPGVTGKATEAAEESDPASPPPPNDTVSADKPSNAAASLPTAAAPAAAPSVLALPPRVRVPSPPTAVFALPPRVAVPQPPSASPPTASQTTTATSAEEAPHAALSTFAAPALPAAASTPSTPVDVQTFSGAGMEEEEEEVDDDDSYFSNPPLVEGGTVEKTTSPPESHRGNARNLFAATPPASSQPAAAAASSPEEDAPRYTASAMSSALGHGER